MSFEHKDILDIQELHERYNELKEAVDEHVQYAKELIAWSDNHDKCFPIQEDLTTTLDSDEAAEFEALNDIIDDLPNPKYGGCLIADHHFEDYARETADDMGGRQNEWPFTHIDWAAAADSLKQDYQSVEIDGVEYWYKN